MSNAHASRTSWQEVASNEALVWRNEQAGPNAIPFIECPRHVCTAVRLLGSLDRERFSRCVMSTMRRHVVLHARFEPPGPIRYVASEAIDAAGEPDAIRVRHFDLRDVLDDRRPLALSRLLDAESNTTFELGRGPLCRVALIRVASAEHVFSCTAHHIVFDGWSRRVLLREVAGAYASGSHDVFDSPGLDAEYRDYVAYQRDLLQSDRCRRQLAYWQQQLRSVKDVRIPADCDETESLTPARRRRVVVPAAAALRRVAQQCRVTLAMTTLAACVLFVHALTGETQVTVGVPVADRPRRAFEGLIGLLMNALPIRSDLSAVERFTDLVTATSRTFAEADAHRELPYGELVEVMGCADGRGWVPFRVVVNFLNASAPAQFHELITAPIAVLPDAPAAADVSFHLRVTDDDLECVLICRADRFTDDRARDLARDFAGFVSNVLSEPDAPLHHVMQRRVPHVPLAARLPACAAEEV